MRQCSACRLCVHFLKADLTSFSLLEITPHKELIASTRTSVFFKNRLQASPFSATRKATGRQQRGGSHYGRCDTNWRCSGARGTATAPRPSVQRLWRLLCTSLLSSFWKCHIFYLTLVQSLSLPTIPHICHRHHRHVCVKKIAWCKFLQIQCEKLAFFTDSTRKIGVFWCKFYSPKILPV